MAQIQAGTVAITNGSNRVISSTGVDWSQVTTSSWFSPLGSTNVYSVASTTSPGLSASGNWELTVVGVIQDATNGAIGYTIVKDFTPNLGLPLWTPGDIQTAQILSRMSAQLDQSQGSSTAYEENNVPLTSGFSGAVNVTFAKSKTTSNYVPRVAFINTVDASPLVIAYVITARSQTGFTVTVLTPTDSANYVMAWSVGTALASTWLGTYAVNVNTTPVTVNANSTSAQNLMSYSVPGGLLNVSNKTLRLFAAGLITTQTAQTPTVTMTIKLGGVTLATLVSTALTAAQTNLSWSIDDLVMTTVTTGTSGTLEVHGLFNLELVNNAAIQSFIDSNIAVSAAVNLTIVQTLQITVTFSTNAATANTCTQRQMVIELTD